MATLYVENVPDDIYKALRKRARTNRKSIAAEVISLLEQNIPTAAGIETATQGFEGLARLRAGSRSAPGRFPPPRK